MELRILELNCKTYPCKLSPSSTSLLPLEYLHYFVVCTLDNYFRINKSKYSGNAIIPSQPVSFSTAYEILR